MTKKRISIMGLFGDESQTVRVIADLKSSEWPICKVYSPIPGHKLSNALGLPVSPLGWFTLAGGVIGFFSGFLLAVFSATQWNLIVGGKPIVALVPFFIVGFEFTILFAVFGNILGLVILTKLPDYRIDQNYDHRCSGHCFGILATCEADRQESLELFFTSRGGTVRIFG